jgi:spermidine/putrescine-binding protein
MKKIIALVLTAVMALSILPLLAACNNAKTINLLNWGDYLDPDLIDAFKKETGYSFKETNVTSNEEMLIQLDQDDCPYDMCIPSDYAVERLISKGRLAEIDYNNIPNIKYIDKDLLKKCEVFDPGNKYSVPYTWGILGIMYNTKMVDEADLGSWDLLWNEKYAGQIYMYNSIRDSMAAALIKCGYDINTDNEQEINEAADALIELRQKGIVQAWLTDDVKDNMVNEDGAIALVYSGDAVWSMNVEDGGNADLSFYVPEEGSNIYFDNIVIPVNSKKKAMAEEFINFLLDPENAAKNTEFIGYSSPNTEVAALIDEFFTGNPAYSFSEEQKNRCEIFRDLGDKIEVYEKAWDRVFK